MRVKNLHVTRDMLTAHGGGDGGGRHEESTAEQDRKVTKQATRKKRTNNQPWSLPNTVFVVRKRGAM